MGHKGKSSRIKLISKLDDYYKIIYNQVVDNAENFS